MTFSSPSAAALHYQRVGKPRQQAWRAAGRCTSCGKPAAVSKTGIVRSRCTTCLATSARCSRAYAAANRREYKARERARRAAYAAAGRCQCGRPVSPGKRTCEKCRADNARRARQWVATKLRRYVDSGLCVRCDATTGINPSTGRHYRYCFEHRVEQSASAAARRAKRLEEGR